jgi:hypothetical protein
VVVALFGYLIPYRLLRLRPSGRAGMRVLTSALVGIGLGFVLVGWMTEGAEDVYEHGNGNIVLTLAGFPNQWATVSDGDGKVLTPEDRWLVLGQDGGSYTFYDCGKMATVRRPIEATILTEIVLDPDFSEGGTENSAPAFRSGVKPTVSRSGAGTADSPPGEPASRPAQTGRFCCSMYWRRRLRGAPPTEPAK